MWYQKSFINIFKPIEKEVAKYLNELNISGVTPDNIKVAAITATWVVVYYFNDKEIK